MKKSILGGAIGDFVGSIYEFRNIKTKQFDFFQKGMDTTDDTNLSMATAKWILDGTKSPIAQYYLDFTIKRPNVGYGGSFVVWANTCKRTKKIAPPYNSCGNGSAMRVGPVGWAASDENEALRMAKVSAECTHNHPEGIKGAQAAAICTLMARQGKSKKEIEQRTTQLFGYNLSFTCDSIRETYGWHWKAADGCDGGTCQASVPQAIRAFLDSTDFEDCIRNAISIGGDSDTIGIIAGNIAGAFYGVPNDIYDYVFDRLPDDFKEIITDFDKKYA